MPDRTKMPRTNAGRGPQYVEVDGDEIRSDLNQDPQIPRVFADTQLNIGSICSVGNQMCPPGATYAAYEPAGKRGVGEEGPAYLPRPRGYHGH